MSINRGIFAARMRKSPAVTAVSQFKARVLADSGTFEAEACLLDLVKKLRVKGLFQRVTLMLTPTGYKSGKLYTIRANTGGTDFATTNGGGSRVNASGNIVALASGMPKIDYTNGSCPEILLERASTNILLNSETLSSQTVTTTAQYYLLSFYGTGTVTVGESTPVVLNGTGANTRVYVQFQSTGGSKTITVTGTVKYAQLAPASVSTPISFNFPTSWIPTTSASVTRSISTLVKTGLSGLINQSKGTIIFCMNRRGAGSLFRMDDGTNTNSIRFNNVEGDAFMEFLYTKNDIPVGGSVPVTLPSANDITVALRYDGNVITIYVNGSLYYTVTNSNTQTAAYSRFSFTPSFSSIIRLKYFAYIPDAATDSELILYSTPV